MSKEAREFFIVVLFHSRLQSSVSSALGSRMVLFVKIMMKDYKRLHQTMWTNYKQLFNSVVGQYLIGSSDVIVITMGTGQFYKKEL